MKKRPLLYMTALMGTLLTLQSCARSSDDIWEDTKSAGRHIQRSVGALAGNHGSSRQVQSRGDFECVEDDGCYPEGSYQDCEYQDAGYQDPGYQNGGYQGGGYQDNYSQAEEYVPLQDPANDLAMADMQSCPPRETPGEYGSSLPGIDAFRDPSTIPQLAPIFRPIYFSYNCDMIKGPQNLQTMHMIADYMRYHPRLCVFIEGHTDERGAQAYNLALGARRANAIRNLLIANGVNPNNLFTVTYGKERPVVLESHEEGWSKNRRGEFKVYER